MPSSKIDPALSSSVVDNRVYRITAPLVDFSLKDGELLPGRIDLGCSAILARLNAEESTRLKTSSIAESDHHLHGIDFRLELLNVHPNEAFRQWQLLVHEFMLIMREPLSVLTVVLDRHDGGVWRRGGWMWVQQTIRWSHGFPAERLAVLRNLRIGMGPKPPAQVTRALDHYERSVDALWRGDFDSALVMGALSLESLLGYGFTSEVSYRLSLRAATLVGSSNDVFEYMRKLYSLRSGVVHGGKSANFEQATKMQQALMRLVPAVAALVHEIGTYEGAMQTLDEIAVDRSVPLPATIQEAGWWSYVPLVECFQREMPELWTSWPDGEVVIVD